MDQSIYSYILRYSLRGQIVLLVVTALSMPFIYLSLEVPKIIINEAIGGQGMPESLLGVQLDQVAYLLVLCFTFLGLVLVNGGFKYFLNVYRGVLGERMLRRFRYELYTRLLRFPLPHFKRVSAGEVIPMITAETEPLGGFIGEAYSLPAFQGGLLLTYLFFIFNQDMLLGAAATAMYPFQLYVIPKLQRRVNALAKQRVLTARQLATRIGDSVSGIAEIHANDTSHFERADIARRLGLIFSIRFQLYKKKFFIKFLNNFLAQVTPFFFYSVGGYFVIRGNLSLGALVAVLAAYKDLASPWNELLKYYQTKEDVRVKYAQIIEQFAPPNMLDEGLLQEQPGPAEPLRGELLASNLSFAEDSTVRLVDGANFQLSLTAHTAVVGGNGSGKDELGRLLARLLLPSAGRISVGDLNLAELPEAVIGRRIGYVGQSTHLQPGSVRDNLLYALKHLPAREPEYGPEERRAREREVQESQLTANCAYDLTADWIDYASAGVADGGELEARALELLRAVELHEDLYQLGLRSNLDVQSRPDLAQGLLKARSALQARLQEGDLAGLVEPFDEARYNHNASVAENLLFGAPHGATLDLDRLASHPYMLRTLTDAALLEDLHEVGRKVAETMVDLFADLPPGHEFFEQFSFIGAEELPDYQQLLTRVASGGMSALEPEAQARLLTLAFKLVPARHRLGLIDEHMQERILRARAAFRANLPAELHEAVSFFDAAVCNPESSLLDNILFGKRAYGQAHAEARLGRLVSDIVEELGLRDDILRVGLDFDVGIGGGRLSLEQRQKLALARSLLKRPDLLVLNGATGALESAQEARVLGNVRAEMSGRGLVWISARPDLVQEFDHVLVLDAGKVVEQGTYAELQNGGATFKQLLAGG